VVMGASYYQLTTRINQLYLDMIHLQMTIIKLQVSEHTQEELIYQEELIDVGQIYYTNNG
jgi:hypothetical protein